MQQWPKTKTWLMWRSWASQRLYRAGHGAICSWFSDEWNANKGNFIVRSESSICIMPMVRGGYIIIIKATYCKFTVNIMPMGTNYSVMADRQIFAPEWRYSKQKRNRYWASWAMAGYRLQVRRKSWKLGNSTTKYPPEITGCLENSSNIIEKCLLEHVKYI